MFMSVYVTKKICDLETVVNLSGVTVEKFQNLLKRATLDSHRAETYSRYNIMSFKKI